MSSEGLAVLIGVMCVGKSVVMNNVYNIMFGIGDIK